MLSNTLEIVEKSLVQLQYDRDRLRQENEKLKKYLTAKDIDVDFEKYQDFVRKRSYASIGSNLSSGNKVTI